MLPARSLEQTNEAIAFLVRLGRALHGLGHSSHSVEQMLGDVADRLGLRGQFFTTPTSIFAAFGEATDQRTFLSRVDPGELHLERLARVQDIALDVMDEKLLPRDGIAALDALDREPQRWSYFVTAIAFGVAGAAAARFLGGGLPEIAVAAAMATLAGMLGSARFLPPETPRVFEPLAAFLVSALVSGAATEMALSTYVATLGGLIVLVPGLALSAAIAELNSQQLVSGTARLTGAMVRFLGLASGVVLGAKVAGLVLGAAPASEMLPLPGWTEAVALVLAPLAFTVLMRARPADAPAILGVCVLAFLGGRTGAAYLGPELGVFTGAFAAAFASNVLARWGGLPPMVTLNPALVLLVPGSIGFRSLAFLLEQHVVDGIQAAFRMVLMFAGLVSGIQVASVALAAPRLAEIKRLPGIEEIQKMAGSGPKE
jgi:uncharacterized membrane protein YjjP (DUF1212 family)